jgi:hypothetical protein
MTSILCLQIFLLIAVLFAALSIIGYTIVNGISPMPTSYKARKTMLQLIRKVPFSGAVVDLGSGWGTICHALARAFPNVAVTGYENSRVPFFFSLCIGRFFKRKNLRFVMKNFYHASLRDTGMIMCYLYPGAMTKLKNKFEKELKPGTIVVSNTFAVPGWKPDRVVEVNDFYRTNIYIYRR